MLPYPRRDANKYTRGRLVLVAGSAAYPGAACLAALAAARMGAGYTEVVTEASAVALVQAFFPSLVVRDDVAWLGRAPLASSSDRPSACAVGSGFDADDVRTSRLLFHALDTVCAPVLVDGGAFAALASEAGRALCKKRFVAGCPTVVTPHLGEAVRLAEPFGLPINDPRSLASALSLAYGATVVLKGPVTWISDGETELCMDEGVPALAKAGTGDVLAGMIGSLLAQRLAPLDACLLATTLHAHAAGLAAEELTP